MGDPPEDWAPLVDLSGMSIPDLLAAGGDSTLSRSLERILRDLDDPNGVISAFSSFAV